MAVPSYTEDLTDIDLAQNTTGYAQWNPVGGGGNISLGSGADFAIQGNVAVDGKITNTEKGILFNNSSGITLGTGDHVYVWAFNSTPGLSGALSARGLCIGLGTGNTTNFVQYHVEGNDTYGAEGRVARCYPIDYTNKSTNGSVPYRTQVGTAGANPQYFGVSANITATVKGSNIALDAMRYGTGAYLTDGELTSEGDASDNPCTFQGFNAQDDLTANKWGILVKAGGGFELQGKFAIGQNNSKVATRCVFQDSNTTIVIPDTVHSATDFSEFIIDQASSYCEWSNVNITALGTNNRGKFTVNSANPTVSVSGGVWNGIGLTTLRSNSTMSSLTWLGAQQITGNGAQFNNCIIDSSDLTANTAAVVVSDLSQLSNCVFTRGTNGHAVELTSLGTGSMTWTNTQTGYSSTSGAEALYVNVGSGTLNLSVSGDTPDIRTAGATVNIVGTPVDVTATAIRENGDPVENARVVLFASGTSQTRYIVDQTVTLTSSGTTVTATLTAHGLEVNDKVIIFGANETFYDGVQTITAVTANTFTYTASGTPSASPATGTIQATYVALSGLTNASGVITESKVYDANVDVSGRSRKSSSAPFLKEGLLSGQITTTGGFTGSAVMGLDE